MSRTVVVLCPNARREIIKVTPNSSILQVLEEACKKQNLNPEDYDLRHSNKTLDLSLPIRFSNLPNNAQVELRPAEKARKDSLVTLCVQLESGERLTSDFAPSASVYDVVEKCLKSDSIAMQDVGEPVCIYMRQTIAGDSIKTTTLRSLGLTKGQAIIRLLYRKPEELEQQAHVSSPLVAPSVEQEDNMKEHRIPKSQSPRWTRNQNSPPDGLKPIEVKTESEGTEETPSPMDCSNWDSVPVKEEQTVGETSHTDYGHWDSVPNKEEKIAGETSHTDYGHWDSVPTEEERNTDQTSHVDYGNRDSVSTEDEEGIRIYETELSKTYNSQNCGVGKGNYMLIQCFSEPPKEDTCKGIGDIKYIGERHAVIYNLDEITDTKNAAVIPDEFFDLTVNDARYLMNDYKKVRSELENQPLLTKEQRERKILQNLSQYNETVIRVYFPERLVLQAVFTPNETVETLSDFIRNYLDDRNVNFYLYKTPPKEILNPSKTLLESMLVPAVNIYFGCESQCPSYLKKSLWYQLSDPRAASLAASESRKSNTADVPDISIENIVKEEKIEDTNPVVNNVSPAVKPQSSGNVPKWLKLSRK